MREPELISMLVSSGISIWIDGNNLKWKAPEGVFPDSLKVELKTHKAAIISFLAGQRRLGNLPGSILPDQETTGEWLVERSSIMEHEGKLPRQEADKLATVDGSKHFCPSCRVNGCAGCLLEMAFIGRQESARLVVESAKEIWDMRVSELTRQGVNPSEAAELASHEVRESGIWRDGMNI